MCIFSSWKVSWALLGNYLPFFFGSVQCGVARLWCQDMKLASVDLRSWCIAELQQMKANTFEMLIFPFINIQVTYEFAVVKYCGALSTSKSIFAHAGTDSLIFTMCTRRSIRLTNFFWKFFTLNTNLDLSLMNAETLNFNLPRTNFPELMKETWERRSGNNCCLAVRSL